METTITRNVADIPATDKRSLEGILGAALEPNQQVFIVAYTPGSMADDATRNRAMDQIGQMIAASDARAKALGITAQEADSAVEEAMQQIRRRPA